MTQPNPRPALESEQESIKVHVHNLTAKYHLNLPIEETIPETFLVMADQTRPVQYEPWIFKPTTQDPNTEPTMPTTATAYQDPRSIDLDHWPSLDTRFCGVFRMLRKAPDFGESFYDGGSRCGDVGKEGLEGKAKAQGQVIYALLTDIVEMLGIKRQARYGLSWVGIRLLNYPMKYQTGPRLYQRHNDAPVTAGFLSLYFTPDTGGDLLLCPVSTTIHPQSLSEAFQSKFKLILAQLTQHIRYLKHKNKRTSTSPNIDPDVEADVIPDQEIYLLNLHGSRFHIHRALFPSCKLSHVFADDTDTTPKATRKHNRNRNTNSNSRSLRTYLQSLTLDNETAITNDTDPINPHTFHILTSREYNLWDAEDFHTAVRALTGLVMYFMSGEAGCGGVQIAVPRSQAWYQDLYGDGMGHASGTGDSSGNADGDGAAGEGGGDGGGVSGGGRMGRRMSEERIALFAQMKSDQRKERRRHKKRMRKEEKQRRRRKDGKGEAADANAGTPAAGPWGLLRSRSWWDRVWHETEEKDEHGQKWLGEGLEL